MEFENEILDDQEEDEPDELDPKNGNFMDEFLQNQQVHEVQEQVVEERRSRVIKWTSSVSNEHILEMLYVVNNKLDAMREETVALLRSIDIKRVKRNRTMDNRCTFINRRGERCKGYFCNQSRSLCYAHHSIVNKSLRKSHFLYGSDHRR